MILSYSKRVEPHLGLVSLKYLTMGQMIKVSNQLSEDLVKRLLASQEDFRLETYQGDVTAGLSEHINHWKAPISGQDLFLDPLKGFEELAGFVSRFAEKL